MDLATELRQLVATGGGPVEFAQGSYRLRVMPGVGRIKDINFSIWEADGSRWEPIITGWVRGAGLIVSSWRPPGSPANAETLTRFILAGKRQDPASHSSRPAMAPGDSSSCTANAAP
jgi:hypothetical protein